MKILLSALLLLVTFPAVVGTAAATVASAPHPTPAVRLFSWVPADGFPDRFPLWPVHLVGGLQPEGHLERQRG